MTRVVVGVDGSERSVRALVRGLHEARLRQATLEAVHVFEPDDRELVERLAAPFTVEWRPPVDGAGSGPTLGGSETSESPYQHARRRALRRLATTVRNALGDDARAVRGVVVASEDVPSALIDHAKGAELLVIAVRQRNPVGKLILGSDARDVILHSRVPVLAVPETEAGDA